MTEAKEKASEPNVQQNGIGAMWRKRNKEWQRFVMLVAISTLKMR